MSYSAKASTSMKDANIRHFLFNEHMSFTEGLGNLQISHMTKIIKQHNKNTFVKREVSTF